MSRFAVSYACRNFSRLCRSDTGSPDETSARPSLPRMLTSPLVSPPRSAATNASVAASVDSKRLAFITAGLGAAGGGVAAGAVSRLVGAGAWALAAGPAYGATAAAITRTTDQVRGIIDDRPRGHRRHHHRRRPGRRQRLHHHGLLQSSD